MFSSDSLSAFSRNTMFNFSEIVYRKIRRHRVFVVEVTSLEL